MPVTISLRAITPRRAPTIDMKKVERELRDTLQRQVKPDILEAFESTVRTWKTPVKFRAGVFVGGDEISVNVFPSGNPGAQIWAWLDEGTRRHYVAPRRRGGVLAFQPAYEAKTVPGLVGSGPGGASGPFAFSRGHWVSGIPARKWTQKIAQAARRDYSRKIENALRRAVK